MSTSNTISKIGAVLYILWACLHLLAAYSVYVLGRSLDSSMVQGRILQDAWNLLFFSIIAISVAATLNWRNSVWGYWINLATVGIADTRGYRLYLFRRCSRLYARLAWHSGPGILGDGDDIFDNRSTDANQRRDTEFDARQYRTYSLNGAASSRSAKVEAV